MSKRNPNHLAQFSLFAAVLISFAAMSSFSQTRNDWRTAEDVLNGVAGVVTGTIVDLEDARRFDLVMDADDSALRVITDSVATRYIGFAEGADPGEPFKGSSGFAKLRVGDRVRVRGIGGGGPAINADEIVLLGRDVRVDVDESDVRRIEGVVRSVAPSDNRIVIETDRRAIETVVGTETTVVRYRGRTYTIRNLEPGDRVRVEIASTSRGVITASSIEVLEDVRDGREGASRGRTVTSVTGTVTRVDPRLQTFRVDTGREEIRVDAKGAVDRQGSGFRMDQIRAGDRVELSGEFDSTDTFRADTIRFVGREDVEREQREEVDREEDEAEIDEDEEDDEYVAVLIEGTITRALDANGVLVVRDGSGREFRVLVEDDFVVKIRNGYTTADRLEKGGKVAVKAYRDDERNFIAQTIRLR